MDDKSLQNIKQHLQDRDAQQRILKNIERAHSETTVTIGRAASLFEFTENQLRDWEVKNRLTPNKSTGGQRLYPLSELDKLAIIRELLDAKFAPGDIPENIDKIWNAISPREGQEVSPAASDGRHLLIDRRVDENDQNVFWQYFVSQVLRISLLLICEDMPETIAGLVVPLQQSERIYSNDPKDLQRVGLSLVGWLTRNRTFHAFLDTSPSFEFPSDFRIEYLNMPDANTYPFTPYIVIQRRTRGLTLSSVLVETIYRLLQLVYSEVEHWRPSFQAGMRDYVYQVTDFSRGTYVTDPVLEGIMNMVVELGGKSTDGKDRWRFCGLLLPEDGTLPMQQRNLVVRAQSKHTPIRWSNVVLSKNYPGLSFRAYQSGHAIYRPDIHINDHILANREFEETTLSAIAIPVAGENGMAVAALYVASDESGAFSKADQRALRLMTRMIEELLSTYQSRHQMPGKLANLLNNPGLVDLAFRDFRSEDDFINDLDAFLATIQARNDIEPQNRPDPSIKPNEAVSFIAIDIDNQAGLATKYGDQVARNLSREVGLRLRGQLSLLSNPEYRQLYHINADSYYIMLVGMPLDEVRSLALTLYNQIRGDYRIDAHRTAVGRPVKREDMLELKNVTVRLGVQTYMYAKLKEVLKRHPSETAILDVRALVLVNFDESLKKGQVEGGDVIVGWNSDAWGFIRWSSSNEDQ